MDCRTSFTKKPRRGFTLFESLFALTVSSLVAGVIGTMGLQFSRSLAMIMNQVEIEAQSRLTLDKMSQEIRRASSVVAHSTNRLTLWIGSNSVTYAAIPENRTLQRFERNHLGAESSASVLLDGCERSAFEIYQRNATNAAYNSFLPATTADARVVRVRWTLSRTNYSSRTAVGSVVSARIVIRKKNA